LIRVPSTKALKSTLDAAYRRAAVILTTKTGRCTLPEIVSITGHTLRRAQDILDKYLARTSKLTEQLAQVSVGHH
jgi:hypothetical protein